MSEKKAEPSKDTIGLSTTVVPKIKDTKYLERLKEAMKDDFWEREFSRRVHGEFPSAKREIIREIESGHVSGPSEDSAKIFEYEISFDGFYRIFNDLQRQNNNAKEIMVHPKIHDFIAKESHRERMMGRTVLESFMGVKVAVRPEIPPNKCIVFYDRGFQVFDLCEKRDVTPPPMPEPEPEKSFLEELKDL